MKFHEYLELNKNKKIYIDPCSGNNGDKLIWMGMLEVVNRVGISLLDSPEEAQLVIINGGGMFIDVYSQGINKLKYYSEQFPEADICVAPNSFHFKKVDFSSVLKEIKAKVFLFSREYYSKKYIDSLVTEMPNVKSYIDDDLAFNLIDSEFIRSIKDAYPEPEKGRVLVVDRVDVEHSKHQNLILRKLYSKLVPEGFKEIYRKLRLKKVEKIGTELTTSARNKITTLEKGYHISFLETSDISRPDVCNFETFLEKIAKSEYIFTNRLHVGVLGHLLGNKVFMQEGSYHKMTGIYEKSMVDKLTTQVMK